MIKIEQKSQKKKERKKQTNKQTNKASIIMKEILIMRKRKKTAKQVIER